MKALIIAGGLLPPRALVKKLALSSDVIVCADGGTKGALRNGIEPDVVIGDLDSLPLELRTRLKRAKIISSTNQNQTDLEKALLYLFRRKVKRITILGGTGKRIDQTVANISLLQKYYRKTNLKLVDPTGLVEVVRSRAKFRARRGETISLLPVEKVARVTTKGLLYPLMNENLEIGSRGVSNKSTGGTVEIHVRRGMLLLVRLFGRET